MTVEPDDEWWRDADLCSLWRSSSSTIVARAWASLNHSAVLAPAVNGDRPFHGLPRLRTWMDPAGVGVQSEPTTWTVYELFADDWSRVPVVREAVWRSRPDIDELFRAVQASRQVVTPAPTIRLRDAPLDAARLDDLLSRAAAFRVPVVWKQDTESVCSGGWREGFEFFSHDQPPAVLRLEWTSGRSAATRRRSSCRRVRLSG